MNKTEAFGLPKGTVRAVLALLLVGAVIAAAFVPNAPQAAVATLGPLAGVAINAYFNKSKTEGVNNG